MGLKQIDHGTSQYQQMVQLRQDILRKPLGLVFTPEELEKEKQDILIGAFDEEELIGCCILTPQDKQCARLRQMAVLKKLQGTGIGESIVMFAENIARDKGFRRISMHARLTAIGFYEKFGYQITGEPFQEVNLPHHIMEKRLL